MHDKTFWKTLVANQFALPEGATVEQLTPELLAYLASPDAELRDDTAYGGLTTWILHGHYPPERLRAMMAQWLANLSQQIGEQGTDSVLLRSFSALMLAVLVYHDNKASWLSTDELHTLLDAALTYFADERDERGYEAGKGWLHSVAHTADVFKFAARNPKTSAADHRRMLMAIADKVTAPRQQVFVHGEDERMALAVLDVLKRDTLGDEVLGVWTEHFAAVYRKLEHGGPFDATRHALYMNSKTFLRSVYFMLAVEDVPPPGAAHLRAKVFEVLRHFRT